MSVGARLVRLLGQIAKLACEIRDAGAQLQKLERGLADDLAAHVRLPAGSVVLTSFPVLRAELKVPVSSEQLVQIEQFLDILRGTPRVNTRVRKGAPS